MRKYYRLPLLVIAVTITSLSAQEKSPPNARHRELINSGGGGLLTAHTGKDANQAVNANDLRENGNWGFFHEYGHNHQHDLWALPGTGETKFLILNS